MTEFVSLPRSPAFNAPVPFKSFHVGIMVAHGGFLDILRMVQRLGTEND